MPANQSVIDVWMQHPTQRFIQHPMLDTLRRWVGAEAITTEIPIKFTLAAMDEAGVECGVLAAWWGPQGELISNDEVAHWTKAHPGRFIGAASVNLHRPMDAVRELRRAVRQLGFKALRVVPWLWDLPPDDRRYYPLYAECCELGIPFLTQVGHTGPLCPSEPGRPIPYLDHAALEFPELVIIGGHVGFPWTNEIISLATKYPNVHIDTSAYKPKRFPPELVQYMTGHGKHKVLFGTNYPMITPRQALQDLGALQLDATATQLYLHETARKLFKL